MTGGVHASPALRDLVVIVDDQPGVLHRITQALAEFDINIEGLSVLTGNGRAVVHILVTQHEDALLALESGAGTFAPVAARSCAMSQTAPNALAAVLGPLAHAGVNVEHAHLSVGPRTHTRIVRVVDEPDVARASLETIP